MRQIATLITHALPQSQRLNGEISGGQERRHRQHLFLNIQFPFAQQGQPRIPHGVLQQLIVLLLRQITRDVHEREENVVLTGQLQRQFHLDLLVPRRSRIVMQHRAGELRDKSRLAGTSINALKQKSKIISSLSHQISVILLTFMPTASPASLSRNSTITAIFRALLNAFCASNSRDKGYTNK